MKRWYVLIVLVAFLGCAGKPPIVAYEDAYQVAVASYNGAHDTLHTLKCTDVSVIPCINKTTWDSKVEPAETIAYDALKAAGEADMACKLATDENRAEKLAELFAALSKLDAAISALVKLEVVQ